MVRPSVGLKMMRATGQIALLQDGWPDLCIDKMFPAGGPPFAFILGCPILDGFQGWGFSAVFLVL
jgi:hypothetical protein